MGANKGGGIVDVNTTADGWITGVDGVMVAVGMDVADGVVDVI